MIIEPILINLHPNKYNEEFHYYPFSVKLDRCVGVCCTLNDWSKKVCVPNKTEDLDLGVFNMITGINEAKAYIMWILINESNKKIQKREGLKD